MTYLRIRLASKFAAEKFIQYQKKEKSESVDRS